ncbi:hypothetical protein SKAU_G00068860 [Synaphobranchus kaupii]|uniref:Uncharacterized protein n=1 Tax=Synaphobranchus kaupii TaxID=118154 RepID=A0A9Q1JAB7_SYNKA|nr:hypothetical protein SKAU_G00068860 [Synaphobranchus kaupii]
MVKNLSTAAPDQATGAATPQSLISIKAKSYQSSYRNTGAKPAVFTYWDLEAAYSTLDPSWTKEARFSPSQAGCAAVEWASKWNVRWRLWFRRGVVRSFHMSHKG